MATVRHTKVSGETNPLDGRVGGEDWDADHSVVLTDGDIPASIARDTEVTASLAAHEALEDPHPGYLTPAEGNAAYEPIGALRTAIVGLGNSETTYTSGTVAMAALGALTIRSTTGNAFELSVAAQSVQSQGMVVLSASDALFSSGTVVLTGIGGGITVGTGAGSVRLSVAAPVAQTVQTQNAVDMSLSGNTAGALALISSGTVTLAGGNNITLSQNGNAVTISGPAAAGAQTAISGLANSQTTYTSGTVSLGELGAITIRSTTGNQYQFSVAAQSAQTGVSGIANSQTTYTSGTVSLSVVAGNLTIRSTTGQAFQFSLSQTVQAETQTFVGGIQNSETTYTSGTVNLSVNGGALTIRSTTGNAFQFSVSQSVQAETQTFVGGLGNSQTTYTSGTVNLSVEGGALTIRSTTGQAFRFSISQSVQAETQTFLGALGNSETTYTSGTVNLSVVGGQLTIRSTTGNAFQFSAAAAATGISGFSNSNTTYTSGTIGLSELGAITIRSTTGNQFQFSVNSQSVQTQNVVDASLAGNTSGALALISSGTMILAGGNNITLSQNGQSVTISAPNLGAGAMSAGVSNLGNTAGATGVTGTRLVFVGTNGISLSQTTDANGGTVSIADAGIYGLAINAATTYTSGTVVFSNGNGVTFGTNAQTITASIPLNATLSSWYHNTAALYSMAASGQTNASASVVWVQIPQDVSFTRVDVPVSFQTASSATAATAAVAFSNVAVIYSRNGVSLNPIVGASNTITVSWVSNSGIASSATGARLLSFGLATALSPGQYWFGLHVSSTSAISTGAATTALNGTLSMLLGAGVASATATAFGDFNAATNASDNRLWPLQGLISSAITATSQTLQQSQITQSGAGLVRANPILIFR
jgi:hypothetical protein